MFGMAHQKTFAEGVALVEQGLALIASQDLDSVPAANLGEDIKVLSSLADRLALQRTRRLTVFDRRAATPPAVTARPPTGCAQLSPARLREQQRRRKLRLFELPDGMTGIEGALPPEGGVMLRLCLQSLIGIPPADDERTQVQRNADGVMELCKRQLDSGTLPTIGGRRPHLIVIVHEETLAGTPGAPPAQLEGAGPISVETAKRLTSDGTISFLTVDAKGVPLSLGRARRLASEPQRRVLAARELHCGWPGCTWEARFCTPHHLDEWWKGGGTDVDRMVLICLRHHAMLFEGGHTLELQPDGSVKPIPPPVGASGLTAPIMFGADA